MFPLGDDFSASVASTGCAILAVEFFLTAALTLNRNRTATGFWADIGAWSLILLAVAWPLNIVLAILLVAGLAVAMLLVRKQEAASDRQTGTLAALIVLSALGTSAMALHYWFETGSHTSKHATHPRQLESSRAHRAPAELEGAATAGDQLVPHDDHPSVSPARVPVRRHVLGHVEAQEHIL